MTNKIFQMQKPILRYICDGACSKNGSTNAKAGWAYGQLNENLEIIEGTINYGILVKNDTHPKLTNNMAELIAIGYAVKNIKKHPKDSYSTVVIYSDSQYSINALTIWIHAWRMNYWKTTGGKSVKNRMWIETIARAIEELDNVIFKYVKGHSKSTEQIYISHNIIDGYAAKSIQSS